MILAHLLGDWILQTEWQATNKMHNWRAMLAHVAVYHLVLCIALLLWFGPSDPFVYIVVVSLAVTHAFIDRRWPIIALMRALRATREREPEGWLVIIIDQCVHVLLLGAGAYVLARTTAG